MVRVSNLIARLHLKPKTLSLSAGETYVAGQG